MPAHYEFWNREYGLDLKPGDAWRLEQRFNPAGTLYALNKCWYHDFDPALADQATHMAGLMPWWQQRFAERFASAAVF